MITIQHVTETTNNLKDIQELYHASFPENERRPFHELLTNSKACNDFLAFYNKEQFLGFACLLSYLDLSHILYFAIDPAFRLNGYGSKALRAMHEYKQNMRIIADLEKEREGAQNNDQRRKRRSFYLKNGYKPSTVSYTWREEEYEMFVLGSHLTNQEFDEFWEHFDLPEKDYNEL